MSASSAYTDTIDRMSAMRSLPEAPYTTPEILTFGQRMGRLVGEVLRKLDTKSKIGHAVIRTAVNVVEYLKPSNAPTAVKQPEDKTPDHAAKLPRNWADLAQPQIVLSDTDHDLLAAAALVVPLVDREPAAANVRVPGPRTAPYDDLSSEGVTAADMAWLASQAGTTRTPAHATQVNDPTVGLYTEAQLLRIENAFAVVESGARIASFADANRPQ